MKIIKKLNQYYNSFNMAEDYIERRIVVNNYPKVIAIELTNRCNYRCSFCPPFTRESGFMSEELLKHILDTTVFSNDIVQLHFHGESLLHPKLGKMIALCKKYKLAVGLSTNASILNLEKSKDIISNGLDYLIIAFDGVSKEIYEKYRVNGNYDKVKKYIIDFLNYKESLGAKTPFVDLNVIKTNESVPLIDDYIKFWEKTSVNRITVKSFSTRAGQIDGSISSEDNWYFGERIKRYPCDWFWTSVIILWDGRVVPCCHDLEGKLILGDIRKETLQQIWNNDLLQRIRLEECENNHEREPCKYCNEWYGRPGNKIGYIIKTIKDKIQGEKIFKIVYEKIDK